MDYLTRRNGYYYFRAAVPRDLLSVVERREIKKALKTRRLQHARTLAKVWGFRVEKLFFLLRCGMLTDEQIRDTIEEFKRNKLKELDDDRLMGRGVPKKPGGYFHHGDPEGVNEIDTLIDNYDDFMGELREDLAHSNFRPYETGVDDILSGKGVTLDKSSLEYKKMCRGFMGAWLTIFEREKERARGVYDDKTATSPQGLRMTEGRTKTLGEVIRLYLNEKKPTWKGETFDEYKRTFETLLEYLGDVDVTGIRGEDFVRFRDFLMLLPPNKAKVKAWKGKTLHEIEGLLRENPSPKRLAEKTRNNLLERVTGLMSWAEDKDHVRKNLAKRITVKTKKRSAREDWKPYDKADLLKLLESPWYVEPQGDREAARRWIPIIALYTGMRLGEICQLFLSDIEQDEAVGVHYFNINVEEGEDEDTIVEKPRQKSVKTPAGIRFVPVHPTLIELGFLKYVERLRQEGEERLWPDLPTYDKRQYYSFYFGKWYQYNNNHFITTEKKKSFRSFRRTFRSELERQDVNPRTANDIMGHEQGDIGGDRYTTPRIEKAYQAILKLDYGISFEGINLPV